MALQVIVTTSKGHACRTDRSWPHTALTLNRPKSKSM